MPKHLLHLQSFHNLHPLDIDHPYFTALMALAKATVCPLPWASLHSCYLPLSLSQITRYAKCKWLSWLTSIAVCQLLSSSPQHTCSERHNTELTRRNVNLKDGEDIPITIWWSYYSGSVINLCERSLGVLYKHIQELAQSLFLSSLCNCVSSEIEVWQKWL